MSLSRIADWVSIVGFVLTLIGLGATFWNVRKTRQITEQARRETKEAILKFQGQLLVNILTSVLRSLDMIEKARYNERKEEARDYCGEALKELRGIAKHRSLSEKERDEISEMIDNLVTIKRTLETAKTINKTGRNSRQIGDKLDRMSKLVAETISRLESAVMVPAQ